MAEQMSPPGTCAELLFSDQTPVLLDRSFFSHEPYESHLWVPPRSTWLIDPFPRASKIPTPVDERGLVQPHLLVEAVKNTIHPDFAWPLELSVHHLYYTGWWYGMPSAGPKAANFRELPIHKILVPKMFENWLHLITLPPDMPAHDVMEQRIESWSIAKGLFKTMRSLAKWERDTLLREKAIEAGLITLPKDYHGEDIFGRAYLQDTVEDHFKGIEQRMQRLRAIPSELRLIEPQDGLAESVHHRNQFTTALGSIVVRKALPMTRLIRAA